MVSYKNEKIHFIGVGGASMSALAKLVYFQGGVVSGSDRERSKITCDLEKCFPVFYGEHPEIVEDCDKIIYSSAIQFDNLELKRARELNIPTIERHKFLGEISQKFQKTVAIGGTHGKTTVTAMVAHGLKALGVNFSAHIGGETEYGNLILSGDEIFVTEACEYKKSLLSLKPFLSVLLNVELDHPDCYEDMKSLLRVYLTFLEQGEIQIFPAKLVNICRNEHMTIGEYEKINNAFSAIENAGKPKDEAVIVFSNGNMTIWSGGEMRIDNGTPYMSVYENERYAGDIALFDKNMASTKNTLVVVSILALLGYSIERINDALKFFKGVKRRNEFVGTLGGARVVFDYAHHPTQIRHILSSIEGKKLVVFQPHTYSRTRAYFDEFVSALSLSDKVILMGTYGAREALIEGADSQALAEQISTKISKTRVEYAKNTQQTIERVISLKNDYDYILFLGAGDIYLLKDELVPLLNDVCHVEVQDIV